MNERIKELAEQAGLRFTQLMSNPMVPVVDGKETDLEKFAQLIVKECMKLCEHESNDDEYDQYDMGMSVKAEDIKASIMKEFGVEE